MPLSVCADVPTYSFCRVYNVVVCVFRLSLFTFYLVLFVIYSYRPGASEITDVVAG